MKKNIYGSNFNGFLCSFLLFWVSIFNCSWNIDFQFRFTLFITSRMRFFFRPDDCWNCFGISAARQKPLLRTCVHIQVMWQCVGAFVKIFDLMNLLIPGLHTFRRSNKIDENLLIIRFLLFYSNLFLDQTIEVATETVAYNSSADNVVQYVSAIILFI